MWIRAQDKLIDAVVFVIHRNWLSKQKYAIIAMCGSGGMSAEPQIIAYFDDKEQANAELDRILVAIADKEKIYHIPKVYYKTSKPK